MPPPRRRPERAEHSPRLEAHFAPVRRARLGATLMLAVLLGACSTAPRYERPAVPLAAGWKGEAPAGWVGTDAHRRWRSGRWWELFDDADLNALMPGIDVGNQNLALALANMAQAQALLQQAQAQRWPGLAAQAAAQRSGRPANGSASLGLGASWAPDLWGRLGDAVRAQGANVQAGEANLEALRLAARAGLANAYFGAREADAEGALVDAIVVGYRRALQITENNYRAAQAAQTDVLQARSTLESALASRAALAGSRATYEHAIALLLGRPPAAFTLPVKPWIDAVPALPVLLPSELLLRRPDVAAAERAVAAANAQIGVAQSAYFPSFTLSAAAGGGASSLARLASAPTFTWSLGTSLAQSVFDAGARSAALAQARAAHAAATASYRQTALTAFGQVENQLTALASLAAQIEHTRAAADAAKGAEERILRSYQAGISAYANVITAQATALAARRAVLQQQLQRQQAVVALIQALGGGWIAPWEAPAEAARADADAVAQSAASTAESRHDEQTPTHERPAAAPAGSR